jgi:hypothetical protein
MSHKQIPVFLFCLQCATVFRFLTHKLTAFTTALCLRYVLFVRIISWYASPNCGARVVMKSKYIVAYVYWTVQHLDSWIKIDQIGVTCFIISLFTAQHVSNVSTSIFRSLRLILDLFHVLYYSGSMCVGSTVWFGWGGVVCGNTTYEIDPQ